MGVVAHACNPSYLEGRVGRIEVQGQPRQKHETLSENTLEQRGLEV
jgi:hypothetical protein